VRKKFVLTLDLEGAVSGILDREYAFFETTKDIRGLLDFLKNEGVKLSVFVVGEIFERFPRIIDLFEEYGCEFHCHSFTHNPDHPDSEEEIISAKRVYRARFGRDPLGYRTPQGRISDAGIQALEKHGFVFDSSVVPSYYPNPFKYLLKNRNVHTNKNSGIVEIPLTTVTPLRLTYSISHLKLLGYRTYAVLTRLFKLPPTIIFCCHLHDFFLTDSVWNRLPLFWKFIYGRNRKQGMLYLQRTIETMKDQGYSFHSISDIYREYKRNTQGG
jgi:hypothetical protein